MVDDLYRHQAYVVLAIKWWWRVVEVMVLEAIVVVVAVGMPHRMRFGPTLLITIEYMWIARTHMQRERAAVETLPTSAGCREVSVAWQ